MKTLAKKSKQNGNKKPIPALINIDQNLSQKLSSWGLTEYESLTYISLLTAGFPRGGTQLASDTGLHRPYIYQALHKLLEIGLIVEVKNGKLSRYKANPASQLEKIEMQRLADTQMLVEQLSLISKVNFDQESEVIIGDEAIINHQLSWVKRLKLDETQYLIGGGGARLREIFKDKLIENATLQAKKKLTTYYISKPGEVEDVAVFRRNLVNLKHKTLSFIPDNMPTIAIRGDVVELHSYFNPPIVYIIKSPNAASKLKEFFMGLWETAEDIKIDRA